MRMFSTDDNVDNVDNDDSDHESDSSLTSLHSDLGLSDDEDDTKSQISQQDEAILIDTKWNCRELNIKDDELKVEHLCHFSKTPFAQGKFRYAYKGHYCNLYGKLDNTDKFDKQVCVIKKWKKEHVYNQTFWNKDLRIAELANKLAQKWNIKQNPIRKIRVVQPRKQEDVSVHKKDKKQEEFRANETAYHEQLLVEDYLIGDFIKWNSNSGWFKHESSIIQAFCHWTFHYSNGKILLCDAQGM